MDRNIITMQLCVGQVARSWGLFQYDYGQHLIFEGVELPEAYEVHFSNHEEGASKTVIGDPTGVDIPNEFLLSGDPIYVWIYLHVGDSDGETEYSGIISVIKRAKPTDIPPTPVQQSAIDQAIAALNTAVAEAQAAMRGAIDAQHAAEQAMSTKIDKDDIATTTETEEIINEWEVDV